MKYYVKVILENGLISQDIDVFSTMEEAKMFKNLAEKAGNKAEIYEIELIPAGLEKLHEYKIVSKLLAEKLQEQLNTAKKALTEEIESIEKYLDKYGMSSYGANTRQAYLEGLKKALEALEGENND